MGMAEFVLTAVGTLAGVVGTYFAYASVRGRTARRRPPPPAGTTAPDPSPAANPPAYDVYVSHSPADAPWARTFAARLRASGLRVADDEVVRTPGGVRLHAVEQAIRDSAHGLLVFSPQSTDDGWVLQEYAALMERSIESGRLFIPVLVGDAVLPEFARTRFSADFRDADDDTYARTLEQIVRALQNR
ncbi:toll/interleukin-1 receptor domain-containing protein [Streptomyces sp. CMB-StM0423]|uniref:toll/interleukin-1 receptor domain-containing protein n=1 Tax=Streptomyces sp. CMB-StM0423 TaxID=2059884 RepID=UPI000C708E5E|nr:toll/interleukin-1 receptor domain-containing protein [Streptomyces sp. CMB-StM0423]AUH42127.1 toll/interleukin-1 receptor domain-containing protein [Streptomyces sp. CMB-StM0423]